MEQGNQFELVLSEESGEKLRECARNTGRTEDYILELLITGYLQRQMSVIEKRSKETGVPFNDLLNMQFVQLLDFFQKKGGNL